MLDDKVNKMVLKYPKFFKGICKVKTKTIHIFLKNTDKTSVHQNQRLGSLHLMELLRKHLEELLKGDVREGALPSDQELQKWFVFTTLFGQ